MNVLLDTNVLSEPMRERPDAVVMAELEQGGHSLQTASLVIHELSYGIQRLPPRPLKGMTRPRLLSRRQKPPRPVAMSPAASVQHAAAVAPANGQMRLRSWRWRKPWPQAWS